MPVDYYEDDDEYNVNGDDSEDEDDDGDGDDDDDEDGDNDDDDDEEEAERDSGEDGNDDDENDEKHDVENDDDENENDDEGGDDEHGDDDDDDDNDEDDDEEDDEDEDDEVEEFQDEEIHPGYYQESVTKTTRLSEGDGGSWFENRMPLIALACCCLCIIIIAIILGLVLAPKLKGDNDKNNASTLNPIPPPSGPPHTAPFQPVAFPTSPPIELPPSARPPPTPFPTQSPAPTIPVTSSPTLKPTEFPTKAPTISPAPTRSIPEVLSIVADQDTNVHLDGWKVGWDEFGTEDTMLVQHGVAGDDGMPNSVALITFPLDTVPSFDRLGSVRKSAVIRLTHQVSVAERGEQIYTVVRLPQTSMAVERFHGYMFKAPGDEVPEGVVVGPTFGVKPDDVIVNIDVTSLLFENHPDETQFFIMLQDRGPQRPEGGDRFYTRESPTPPQLLIDFQGGNAADLNFDNTEQDDGTSNPESNSTNLDETEGPSETPAPTTFVNETSTDIFSTVTGGGEDNAGGNETVDEQNPTEEETAAPGDGEAAGAQEDPSSEKPNEDTSAPSVVPAVWRRRT